MTKCLNYDVYRSHPFFKMSRYNTLVISPTSLCSIWCFILKEEHSYTRSDTLARWVVWTLLVPDWYTVVMATLLKKDGEATVKSDTFSLSHTPFFYSCEIFSFCPILTFLLSCRHSIALPLYLFSLSLSFHLKALLWVNTVFCLPQWAWHLFIHSLPRRRRPPPPLPPPLLALLSVNTSLFPPTPHHISFCLRRELYLARNRFPGLYPRNSQPLILLPCIRLSFFSLLLPPSICTFLWTGACLGARVLSN